MDNILLNKALFLQTKAKEDGIPLRLIGGVAVFEKCKSQRNTLAIERSALRRENSKEDIDFATLLKYKRKLERFFDKYGFVIEPDAASIPGSRREIFVLNSQERIECDINYDELKYNSVIDFKNRFWVDEVTLPVAELLLSKLQPDDFKEKHRIDVQAILNEFELSNVDLNAINIKAICQHCSSNWCLEQNVRRNFISLQEHLQLENVLSESKVRILKSIHAIITALNVSPKTKKWKLQSMKIARMIANCHHNTDEMRYSLSEKYKI